MAGLIKYLKSLFMKSSPTVVPEKLDLQSQQRLENYKNIIELTSSKYKLDPLIVASVIMQESSGNNFAVRYEPAFQTRYVDKTKEGRNLVSSADWQTERICRATSWGLMQIMGLVARERGYSKHYLSELSDPMDNIEFGCKHLSALMRREGNEIRGLLAYNGGGDPTYPQRIEKWRARIKECGIFVKTETTA